MTTPNQEEHELDLDALAELAGDLESADPAYRPAVLCNIAMAAPQR